MEQKKYKLLKDLPDAKAGTIFTFDGMCSYDCPPNKENNHSWYNEHYVHSNPGWFEEVKEPIQEFKWTEELAIKFAIYSREQPPLQSIQVDLKEFKEQNK